MLRLLSVFACMLPAFVCAFFSLLLLLRRKKTYPLWIMLICCLLGSVDFFAEIYNVSPELDYLTIARLSPMVCFVQLSLPLMMAEMVVSKLNPAHRYRLLSLLVLPVVLATIGGVCLYLAGDTAIADLLRMRDANPDLRFEQMNPVCALYTMVVVDSLPVLEGLMLSVFVVLYLVFRVYGKAGRRFSAFFRGEPINPVYVQAALLCWVLLLTLAARLLVGRRFFFDSSVALPVYSLLLFVPIFLAGYTGLVLDKERVTLSEFFHLQTVAALRPLSPKFDEKVDSASNELCERVRAEVEGQRRFTDPDYNLGKLAQALGVNRVYVSQAINQGMHTNFRDYVSRLRVDEYKRQALAHPELRQDKLAKICGFADTTALSRKFKELEGVAPSQWLRVNRVE